MNFHEAAIYTARLVAARNEKIFVAYSGGSDSEYVMEVFLNGGIPITPIIVRHPALEEENIYALDYCKDRDLKPKIIELNDDQYVAIYKRYIVDAFGGIGCYSVAPVVAALHVGNEGILVTGDHFIDDKDVAMCNGNDWDYYVEHYTNSVIFFNHTPEIVYAMMGELSFSSWSVESFKHTLYGTRRRPKMKPKFSGELERRIVNMSRRSYNPTDTLGSRRNFLAMMETWNADCINPYVDAGVLEWCVFHRPISNSND